MKLALVQESGRAHALSVKVADSVESLLELPFDFDPRSHLPRIFTVTNRDCRSGASLVRAVRRLTLRRAYKVLRV